MSTEFRIRCALLGQSDIGKVAADAAMRKAFAWEDALCYGGATVFERSCSAALVDALDTLADFLGSEYGISVRCFGELFVSSRDISRSNVRMHASLTPSSGANLARRIRELRSDEQYFQGVAEAYACRSHLGGELATAMTDYLHCADAAKVAASGVACW
jgi:hypothetical protein